MANVTHVITTSRSGPPPAQVGKTLLLIGLAAGPLAWGLHLALNFGFASQICFPGLTPRANAAGLGWLWGLLIAIDLVGMAACAVAALFSWRNWRAAPQDYPVEQEVELGEGRSRFLGLWGIVTSALFVVVILFDFVGLWVVPLC